ncbi:IS66-like element accessory protein TnpA [Burkholderia anthina]|uniref:IS66-like element accessory protein TnpA n=1 Tax=Burkholderia anthina TaxID=179879 RepID=UPI003C7D0BD4
MPTIGVVDRVTQTVEIAPKPQTRRHPTEWKRTIVALTFEPGTSVARVARENGINANQVWAWRRLYAQGLVTGDGNPEAMLPVVVTEPTLPTAQTSTASEVSTATDTPAGSSQIQHGKTSIRIEGAPDPAVLRSVLDRICDDRPATKHQDLERSRRHRYALRLQLVGREGTDGAGERSVLMWRAAICDVPSERLRRRRMVCNLPPHKIWIPLSPCPGLTLACHGRSGHARAIFQVQPSDRAISQRCARQ